MNLEQYLKESERTLIDKGREFNLIHASIGIMTELGELLDIFKKNIFYGKEIDLVNLKEELGDICWYLAIPIREYDLKIESYNEIVFVDSISSPYKYKLVENLKNEILEYDKILSSYVNKNKYNSYELQCATRFVLSIIKSWGASFNFTLEDIFETNINKLKIRFKDKFTEEKALNRDLITERKILEGK